MAILFWYFVVYSFLGFVAEVLFARITRNPKRDRKCRYFLPFCPVYGLGALALLLLPEAVLASPLLLFPCAAVLCSAVEYGTGLFYEKVAKVSFWDYSHLPLNVGGRVCLLFSALWGALALALFYGVHPFAVLLAASIPLPVTFAAATLVVFDAIVTFRVLRQQRTTDALRWYTHRPYMASPRRVRHP